MTLARDHGQPAQKRTRRMLLTGGLGGLGAWLAGAVTRPQPALAATDAAAVHKGVNNPTSALTTITCSGATALKVASPSGGSNRSGLVATASGTSSRGVTALGVTGVVAESGSTVGRGVFALNTATTGTPIGALGRANAPGGFGVLGENNATSGQAVGVKGTSKSPSGYGVFGSNSATDGDAYGVRAETSSPVGTAMRAVHTPGSGTGGALFAVTNAPAGYGIQAWANDGTAVFAHVDAAGTALDAFGQVRFSSAGTATVPLGASEVTVSPAVPVPATAKILATVNSPLPVGVLNVERLSSTQFKIVLTAQATASCNVAYFVIR